MSYTFLLGQLPNVVSVLEDVIAELEYYAAYDPDVINCAIAFVIFVYLLFLMAVNSFKKPAKSLSPIAKSPYHPHY
jgi:hypothetical protein